MAQNETYRNITFKVKFLDEYHDIAIEVDSYGDPRDSLEMKEKIASITGIPREYIVCIHLIVQPEYFGYEYRDGACYHLRFSLSPLLSAANSIRFPNRIGIKFKLIPIEEVSVGLCSRYVCLHNNTKDLFHKMNDIINNQKLQLKIAALRLRGDPGGIYKVCKEFNVKQYCRMKCRFRLDRFGISRQDDLYPRIRG